MNLFFNKSASNQAVGCTAQNINKVRGCLRWYGRSEHYEGCKELFYLGGEDIRFYKRGIEQYPAQFSVDSKVNLPSSEW